MIPGCTCGQRPRSVGQGTALCRCAHLVWRHGGVLGGLGGMFRPETLGNPYEPIFDPEGRRRLVAVLKAAVDLDQAALPGDVRDAVAAACIAGEHEFANELDFAHWVASLEV